MEKVGQVRFIEIYFSLGQICNLPASAHLPFSLLTFQHSAQWIRIC